MHTEQSPGHHFGSVFRKDGLSPDDDIGHAAFIFQTEEYRPRRRAGALPRHHQSADCNAVAIRIVALLRCCRPMSKLVTEERERVMPQGQAQRDIVLIDLLRLTEGRHADVPVRQPLSEFGKKWKRAALGQARNLPKSFAPTETEP